MKVMRDDLHMLSGSYVLDALSEPERESFERHLQHCALCGTEVRGLRETAARLGLAKTLDPPPQLRYRVLSAAHRIRQLPPLVSDDGHRPRPGSHHQARSAAEAQDRDHRRDGGA